MHKKGKSQPSAAAAPAFAERLGEEEKHPWFFLAHCGM
jgi:hypothetical protein